MLWTLCGPDLIPPGGVHELHRQLLLADGELFAVEILNRRPGLLLKQRLQWTGQPVFIANKADLELPEEELPEDGRLAHPGVAQQDQPCAPRQLSHPALLWGRYIVFTMKTCYSFLLL